MRVSLTHRTRIAGLSAVLFCISLFLTAFTARRPEIGGTSASLLGEVLGPANLLSSWLGDSVGGVWRSYLALVGVNEENTRLKTQVAALLEKSLRLDETEHELKALRGLMQVRDEMRLTGIVARVVGYDASQWVQSIVLDKGVSDGILPGMAVIEKGGLVGQVIASSSATSKVLLITDPASGVDGLLQDSRARGIVVGSGSTRARWNFVLREEAVNIGDRIITSGMDHIFPRGILIGVVSEVDSRKGGMFQAVEVRPQVDFPTLEHVLVVTSSGTKDVVVRPVGRMGEESVSRDAKR